MVAVVPSFKLDALRQAREQMAQKGIQGPYKAFMRASDVKALRQELSEQALYPDPKLTDPGDVWFAGKWWRWQLTVHGIEVYLARQELESN